MPHTPTSRFVRFAVCLALAPAALGAQVTAGKPESTPALKPPPGMCRIWVDGVPADKQPAPTDCATALKNKPTNSRVVFGDPAPAARSNTPPAMSRSLSTPAMSSFPPRQAPRSARDSAAARDSAKREPPKAKRDSVTRKPPQ